MSLLINDPEQVVSDVALMVKLYKHVARQVAKWCNCDKCTYRNKLESSSHGHCDLFQAPLLNRWVLDMCQELFLDDVKEYSNIDSGVK